MRYVDYTFVIWRHEKKKLNYFPNHLNCRHPNNKSTRQRLPYISSQTSQPQNTSVFYFSFDNSSFLFFFKKTIFFYFSPFKSNFLFLLRQILFINSPENGEFQYSPNNGPFLFVTKTKKFLLWMNQYTVKKILAQTTT